MRRIVAVGATVMAVALASCSTTSGQSAAPSTTYVTVTATPPAATKPAPSTPSPASPTSAAGPRIDASGKGLTVFASPSGNIICAISPTENQRRWIRCDVVERQWTLPPKPNSCIGAWGVGVFMEADQPARLLCASDSLIGSDAAAASNTNTWYRDLPGAQIVTAAEPRGPFVALSYGASISVASLVCTSQTDGVHCTDSASGHGFDVSRESFTVR